jgi:hypothetical protein
MEYKIKVYLPIQDKFEYFKELNNRNTLAISKFIKANDEYGLSKYLSELVDPDNNKSSIDRFAALIQLRALNVSNKVALNAVHKTGDKASYKINLFSFLGDLIAYLKDAPKEFIFNDGDTQYYFGLPKNLYFKNIYALLNDCLIRIDIKGKNVFEDLTDAQKFQYILNLKEETLKKIKDYLDLLNRESTLFFCKPVQDILVPTIKISFFNNTIFNIIKSIFKVEISYFFNKFYVCLTKLGLSYDDFLKLSYVETDILLNIYKSANKLK